MNILNIHIYQGLQNAVCPSGGNTSVAVNRPLSSGIESKSGSLSGASETTLGLSPGVIGQINNLQSLVESNPNIVRDPPFFPIATYQRADLIRRITIAEEAVQRSSLDAGLGVKFSSSQLKNQASDTEISAALDNLFAFRDRLTNNRPASPAKMAPGSILAVKT